MNELELKVKQSSEVSIANFNEIKAALEQQMEIYKNLDVTEETIPENKKDVATLRKMEKAINDKRIAVKKEILKPYDEFEKMCQELTSLIKNPISLISDKLDTFEQLRVAEKKEKIKEIIAQAVPEEYANVLGYDKLFRSEWINKTYSDNSIRSDISEVVLSVKTGVESLRSFQSDAVEKAIQMFYTNGFDALPCIKYINQYEAQRKEILEKKEQEEQQRREEEQRIAEQKAAKQEETKVATVQNTEDFGEFNTTYTGCAPAVPVTIVLTCSNEDIDKVICFLVSEDIDFERR